MPAGFQAINDFGTTLIDDTSPTLAYRTKKVCHIPQPATSNSPFANYGSAYVDFDNCDTPVFAIRPNTAGAWVSVWAVDTLSPTSRRVYIQTGDPEAAIAGRCPALDVTVYHFDRPISSGGSGFGLQVFDANGALTFDSSQKVAPVCAHESEFDTFGSWTLPSGRIGAAVMGITHTYSLSGEEGVYVEQFHRNFFSVNGNVHRYSGMAAFYQHDIGPTDPLERTSGFHSGTLIDVTGL